MRMLNVRRRRRRICDDDDEVVLVLAAVCNQTQYKVRGCDIQHV